MTDGTPIRVLVVDDHPIVRQGLCDLLARQPDFTVLAAVDSGRAALEAAAATPPDLVLLDLRLADSDGLQVLAALRRRDPGLRVVLLSAHDGDAAIAQALRGGAAGYLLKSMSNEEILVGLRAAARGALTPTGAVAERLARYALSSPLTAREVDVLRLCARGLSNRDIGKALGLSEHTVKSYFRNVLAKLEVSDRAEAVAEGIRRGLIALQRE